MKQKILVVAAHPDDEILGCGGTMARLSEEGHEIHIVILGEGITSRQEKRAPGRVQKELSALKEQIQKAARIVGAKSAEVLSFPDNRFDSVDFLEVVKAVESVKERLKPRTIYTHSAQDLNIDHRITSQAVLTACRPVPGESLREIYSFEIASSTEWQSPLAINSFRPAQYITLTDQHIQTKIRALQCYRSETRPFPHARSSQALKALATWRGANVGARAAEAFEVVRRIV